MEIVFEDCVLNPVANDSDRFDLKFYKKVKKKDTGKFEKELGPPLYGLTLYTAIKRIAHYRVNTKYKEAVVELVEYVKELNKEIKTLREYLNEKLPEKFDTGE